ncbi:surface rod structure-forming protein G [Kribbella rubisoli]|uniref:Surface rod structure-forming protein G n=1 Tax=Kribbella rubisoli TaxID=3075929 RepID=A0A4Q7WWY3_9ACTN|nr:G5 domain-containing protein [Kribbella rubisoli]RZU13959.1 surface rod structure-forming protein G [Kribbella rubisoli]
MLLIRAALVVGVGVLVVGCGGGSGTTADQPAAIASVRVTTTPEPSPFSSQPTTAPKPITKATPKATTTTTSKEVVELRTIPFKKRTVTDGSLPKGEKTVRTKGVNGTRRLTYRVTFVNGVQTAKHLLRQEVAKEPRTQVTAVGTKVDEPEEPSGCDPNYSGCVPIASDVDCSGGSGNGPEYVAGPIEVIGSDIYRLDSDHDGIACED